MTIRKTAVLHLGNEEITASNSEVHPDPPNRKMQYIGIGGLGYCRLYEFEKWAEEVKAIANENTPKDHD